MNENNVVITPSDSQRIIKTAQITPMAVNPALLTAAKQVAATGTPLTMNLGGTTQQSTNVITIQNPVTMNLPDAQNIMVAVQRGENVDAELVKAAQTVLQTQTPLQGVMNTTVPVAPGSVATIPTNVPVAPAIQEIASTAQMISSVAPQPPTVDQIWAQSNEAPVNPPNESERQAILEGKIKPDENKLPKHIDEGILKAFRGEPESSGNVQVETQTGKDKSLKEEEEKQELPEKPSKEEFNGSDSDIDKPHDIQRNSSVPDGRKETEFKDRGEDRSTAEPPQQLREVAPKEMATEDKAPTTPDTKLTKENKPSEKSPPTIDNPPEVTPEVSESVDDKSVPEVVEPSAAESDRPETDNVECAPADKQAQNNEAKVTPDHPVEQDRKKEDVLKENESLKGLEREEHGSSSADHIGDENKERIADERSSAVERSEPPHRKDIEQPNQEQESGVTVEEVPPDYGPEIKECENEISKVERKRPAVNEQERRDDELKRGKNKVPTDAENDVVMMDVEE